MPPKVDKKHPRDDSGERLKVSPAAEETYLLYKALRGISDAEYETLREQGKQIVEIVDDFGKKIRQGTREAAYLTPIIQQLSSPDKKTAYTAWLVINQYSSSNSEVEEYVRALTVDIGKKIPTLINSQYEMRTQNEVGQYTPISRLALLDLMGDKDTPKDLVANPQEVNIESALIDAASTYVTLKNIRHSPEAFSDEVIEKTLFTAEACYGTLMQIIGYDGLAIEMKDEVDLIRFARSDGEYDGITAENLAYAREALAELPDEEHMLAVIDSLMSKLTHDKVAISENVLRNTSGHNAQVISGRILDEYMDDELEDTQPKAEIDAAMNNELDEDTKPKFFGVRFVARKKGIGSAARKVTKILVQDSEGNNHEEYKPISDLVAATVITPDVDALQYYFLNASGILKDLPSPQLELTTSRHKTTSFHAKGEKDDSTIKAIEIDLGNLGARLDTRISDNGHKVIKITLQYKPNGAKKPIPFEIQYQTTKDRENSRTGPASHANKTQDTTSNSEAIEYKYDTDPIEVRATQELGKLPKRRTKTHLAGLTPGSIRDSNEEFPRVNPDQETQRALGAIAAQVSRPEN